MQVCTKCINNRMQFLINIQLLIHLGVLNYNKLQTFQLFAYYTDGHNLRKLAHSDEIQRLSIIYSRINNFTNLSIWTGFLENSANTQNESK